MLPPDLQWATTKVKFKTELKNLVPSELVDTIMTTTLYCHLINGSSHHILFHIHIGS